MTIRSQALLSSKRFADVRHKEGLVVVRKGEGAIDVSAMSVALSVGGRIMFDAYSRRAGPIFFTPRVRRQESDRSTESARSTAVGFNIDYSTISTKISRR